MKQFIILIVAGIVSVSAVSCKKKVDTPVQEEWVFSGEVYTYERSYMPSSTQITEQWDTLPVTVRVIRVLPDSIRFESGDPALVSNHAALVSDSSRYNGSYYITVPGGGHSGSYYRLEGDKLFYSWGQSGPDGGPYRATREFHGVRK